MPMYYSWVRLVWAFHALGQECRPTSRDVSDCTFVVADLKHHFPRNERAAACGREVRADSCESRHDTFMRLDSVQPFTQRFGVLIYKFGGTANTMHDSRGPEFLTGERN